MYTNRQYKEDLRILKKAKKRVRTVLILCAAAVCLYPAAVFMILEQPLFTKPDFFNLFYLGSMLVQMVIWLLLFYYASTGAKGSRTAFKIGVAAEAVFCGYLIFDMFRQMHFVVVYLAWTIMLLIKTFFLWRLSVWLRNSYWAKIYYDRILTLPASMKPKAKSAPVQQPAPARRTQPAPAPARASVSQAQPDFASAPPDPAIEAKKRKAEEKALSAKYPRTALRILIFVVAEMVAFPILVHMFANSFASIDNSSVFADNLEFTYCIITTVIWILPVFFLYLKSPGCKKVVLFTLLAQVLIIAFEIWNVYSYSKNGSVAYSSRVYLQFAMVEIARYAILLIGIAPAFKLPEIKDTLSSDEAEDEPDPDSNEAEYEIQMEPESDASQEEEDPIDEEEASLISSIKNFFHSSDEES